MQHKQAGFKTKQRNHKQTHKHIHVTASLATERLFIAVLQQILSNLDVAHDGCVLQGITVKRTCQYLELRKPGI